MKIRWLGHACFLIETEGKRIVTDPYDEKVPYAFPEVSADLVTVSHGHGDHNAVGRVGGDPGMIQGTGILEARGISLRGIPAVHDDQGGAQRGKNILYVFDLEGLKVAHLGDLGAPLDDAQREALADVQVVLCPVGGFYTIDARQAAELARQLPALRVFVPMHYNTDPIADWPIARVDGFVELMDNVRHVGSNEVTLDKDSLPDTLEVWILDYA
ncbi:MAG: MBL fold metallo-hydrolase [Candidatus Bipolaricaulota bacterium]|nr:MAG: MBL fold metallo-hydrolase [Candidatus Bipolaricaulota bacterium]